LGGVSWGIVELLDAQLEPVLGSEGP